RHTSRRRLDLRPRFNSAKNKSRNAGLQTRGTNLQTTNYPSLSETDREWATEMVNDFRSRTGRVESTNCGDRTGSKYLVDRWLAGQDPCQQAANETLTADNQ